MRIIAGQYRGRALAAVGKGDAGAHLRPTTDRVRESLFSMLNSRGAVEDARVLDLFAGTGALGLEALSRGGTHVTFVDDGRAAQGLIRRNIGLLGCAETTRLMRMDATRLPANDGSAFDLIFLDPPYGKGMGEKALAAAMRGGWIAPEALIVWEESQEMAAPTGLVKTGSRKFGDTVMTFLEPDDERPDNRPGTV